MSMTDSMIERRRYFRVFDRVALAARELLPAEFAEQLETGHKPNDVTTIAQRFSAQRERLLPLRRRLEKQLPELSNYLDVLDNQLKELANLVQELLREQNPATPPAPTHEVDISAQGIRFHAPEPFGIEATVELTLTLYPEHITLIVLGTVVDCGMNDDGTWNVALDFEFIGDEEREILVKHVHTVQLATLQRNKFAQRETAVA